jgi:hypothetical protein
VQAEPGLRRGPQKRQKTRQDLAAGRLQFEEAREGHPTMLIWLGKQILGQRDHVEQEPNRPIQAPVPVEQVDQNSSISSLSESPTAELLLEKLSKSTTLKREPPCRAQPMRLPAHGVTTSGAGTVATRGDPRLVRGPPNSVCLPEILFRDRT